MSIIINGVEHLSEEEKSIANSLLEKRIDKFRRQTKNDPEIRAMIKCYNTNGQKRKCSFHITLNSGGKTFKAEESGWQFTKSLNRCLDRIQNEIGHKLHASNQH